MKIRSTLLTLLLLTASAIYAQRSMTVAQVTAFVKSSVEEKISDKEVADVLKKTSLTEKLDDPTVEQMQALGAGRLTMAALRDLARESASLAAPAAPARKAAPPVYTLPDAAEQSRVIEAIRDYALNYTQNLPNFICTQVTRQQIDPTGSGKDWRSENKYQEQLTYFEHHEQYRVVMINNEMVANRDHSKLAGSISEGEFGSMLYEIFAPQTAAEFQYERPGKLDGRLMHVIDYHVPQERSRYQIEERNSGRKIIAGYHGKIWANQQTNAVMRITLECEEIPADFPIKEVTLDMWYDVIKISDQEFVLPLKWDLKSREGSVLSWNTAELTLYRKYSADATITFDEADPSDSKAADDSAKKKKQQ
jgi:hypothetical protein